MTTAAEIRAEYPEIMAYLAGVFDSEGSIFIGMAHRDVIGRCQRHRYGQLDVHISMQNREVMELFAKVFPTSIGTNRAYTFRVAWGNRRALEVIETLRPWLIAKAKQADLAIEYQSARYMPGRNGYTDEEIERFNYFHAKMSELNHADSIAVRIALKQQTTS